jgi:hypothetical protein
MKNKIKLLLAILFYTTVSNGQALDGYKYIILEPLKYQNGATDIWGISSKLRSYFLNKGFIVLGETAVAPSDLEKDRCLLLRCYISHTYVTNGINEVTITLKNCKDQIVHSNTGGAAAMSLQDDYNKATKRAFSQIESMSYSFDYTQIPQIEFPSVEITNETEESIKTYLSTNKLDQIEGIYKSYKSDEMLFYKIGIIHKNGQYKAIIIESDLKQWKTGEVKAIFEPSSMQGFYSVKWYLGDKTPYETFGNIENEALLSIEFRNQRTGEKSKDKFIKMFPPASNVSSFKKENTKASGSGFFLTPSGIIATNAHVVEGFTNIEVTISNEVGTFNYKAKILLMDKGNDVALLQIDDEKFKSLTTIPYGITENSDVGSKVFTIGFPLNDVMGKNYKVTDGIISAKSGIGDDVRYYQISVPLQPGNSGGPLFSSAGNVIGITSSRFNGKAIGTKVENVNYAIKSSYLLNLYYMLPNATKLSTSSQVVNKELEDQVKILKNYVCLIKVF